MIEEVQKEMLTAAKKWASLYLFGYKVANFFPLAFKCLDGSFHDKREEAHVEVLWHCTREAG